MISKDGQSYSRYAIYFKPRIGSALAEFEEKWFSAALPDGTITNPKRYGLHATFKAPFRLKEPRTFNELTTAIKYLIEDFAPVDVGALVQKHMGGFIALVPETACQNLDQLAFDWMSLLDTYRAPTDPAEIERRRAAGLSANEEEMLQKWGYPYVEKSFRFHITLTEKLSKKQANIIQPTLDELLKPVLQEPLVIEDVCLVGDPGEGKPFKLLERFSLTG